MKPFVITVYTNTHHHILTFTYTLYIYICIDIEMCIYKIYVYIPQHIHNIHTHTHTVKKIQVHICMHACRYKIHTCYNDTCRQIYVYLYVRSNKNELLGINMLPPCCPPFCGDQPQCGYLFRALSCFKSTSQSTTVFFTSVALPQQANSSFFFLSHTGLR